MKRIKTILFWLILIAFIGLSVWWIFYFPYDQTRLYRAIPSNAIFVSEHRELARRWKAMAENQILLSVLQFFGIERKDIADIVKDPVVSDMVRRFGSRDTVLAYVPSRFAANDGAWFLSSWAGAQTQVLRSGVLTSLTADLKSRRIQGGRRIWVLDANDDISDRKWSFAVCEGLLLGCLSEDPTEVSVLIDRVERGAPIHSVLEKALDANKECDCLDRGWLLDQNMSRSLGFSRLQFGISACDTNMLAGSVKVSNVATEKTNILATPAFTNDLKQIVGISPNALALLPTDSVISLMGNSSTPIYLKIIARVLKREATDKGLFFASLLGTEFSGRILGLKVPAIIGGVEVKDSARALSSVSETLDKLNARYGGSLIQKNVDLDGSPMIAIDSTRSGVYRSMKSGEKVAFITRGNWLIFCSNMDSLRRLFSQKPAEVADDVEWKSPTGQASAYAWFNLESTGKALQDVIAVLSLMTIIQPDSDQVAEQRRMLESIRSVVSAASGFKTGLFWQDSDANEIKWHFKIGGNIAPPVAR